LEVVPAPLSSPMSSDASSGKKERKSRKAPAKNRQERQEIRKIKHREIDRRRREREKQSVEELKELVALDTGERPEKANVVAGAVRQIKGLQAKIEELQAQLARQHISSPQPSVASTPDSRASRSPVSPLSFLDLDHKMGINTDKILLPDMMRGLGTGGVVVLVLGLEDCLIKNANAELEAVTGFHKSELLDTKLTAAPLFGRLLHSDMTAGNLKQEHPLNSLEGTALQFKEATHRLASGATWKVTTQIKTRDGSIIESQNTIFMVRNADDHTPAYLMCVSTPDKRRVIPAFHATRFPVNGGLTEHFGSSFYPIAQPS